MRGSLSKTIEPVGFFDERARGYALRQIGNFLRGEATDADVSEPELREDPYLCVELAISRAEASEGIYENIVGYPGRQAIIRGSGDTKDDERSPTVLRFIGIKTIGEGGKEISYTWDVEVRPYVDADR